MLPVATPPTEIKGKLECDLTQVVHFLKVMAHLGRLRERIWNWEEPCVLPVLLDILQS